MKEAEQMNHKLRVVMVIPRFPPIKIGGSERQLQRLCPALVERGVSITVLTGRAGRQIPKIEDRNGYKIIRIREPGLLIKGQRRLSSYSFMMNLGSYLLKLRHSYDLIHDHSGREPAVICQLAGNLLNKPCLTKITGGGDNFSPLSMLRKPALGRLLMSFFMRMDNIVVLSKEIRERCLNLGFKPEQLIEIPNGVPLFDQPPDTHKSELRRKLLGSSKLLIVVISNLISYKRIDLFIEALFELKDNLPSFKAYVIGEGPEQKNLRKTVAARRLTDSVIFTGRVDNVSDYISTADIGVHPSSLEGMSNAILEEMSYGLPVIAADIPANIEIIVDGKNGALFKDGDLESLTAKLRWLANDSVSRENLGVVARRTVEERFSLSSVTDRYIQTYKTLIKKGSRWRRSDA